MIRIRDSFRVPGKVSLTYILIVLNVIGLLATMRLGPDLAFQTGGVIPAEFLHEDLIDARLAAARPPSVITVLWSMFLHADFFHLFSNCLALLIFGVNVEATMGRIRFLLFYFACGACGLLLQVLFSLESTVPIIGASGAISGLFGAYFVLFPTNFIRITLGNLYRGFYRDIMLPVRAILVVWLASQIFYGILLGAFIETHVAYMTHLGGFVCGLFIAGGKGGLGGRRFKVFTGGKAKGPKNGSPNGPWRF